MRQRRALILVLLTSALASGCDSAKTEDAGVAAAVQRTTELRTLEMTLAGEPDATDSGVLLASGRRYFQREGLEMFWHTPVTPLMPIKYTAMGAAELSVAAEPQVLIARERGAPIKVIGSIISEPTDAIIWRGDSGIRSIADLKGKTIGIAGLRYERALLTWILGRAGIKAGDVRVKPFWYNQVPALVKGRADAILGSQNIQGLELEARGVDPVAVPVGYLGVPNYDQMVLIARPDRLRKGPKSIKEFMRALARGTAAAKESPSAAAQEIIENSGGSAPQSTLVSVEATAPLLSEDNRVHARQWAGFAAWMRSQGLLEKRAHVAGLVTNAFLSG